MKMKNLIYIVVVVLALVMSVSAIQYLDCGSKGSTVKSVSVTGCEKVKTCPLPKGKDANITVQFTTSKAFKTATAVVHGIVAGIPVPFKIPQPDACNGCGLKCPVASGATENYSTAIHIDKSYPKLRVVVKWELKDQDNNDIFCIEVPAEVVDG